MKHINLCDTCVNEIANCAANDSIVFGAGIGNDNVVECLAYVKTEAQAAQEETEMDCRNYAN